MSDTSDEKPISLNKQSTAKVRVAPVPPPQTIRGALVAMAVLVVATIGSALSLLGSTPTLNAYLVMLNKKAKKPKKPYTVAEIAKDLHALRVSTIVLASVVSVFVVLVMFAMRRANTASVSRWGFLFIMVLSTSVFRVVPTKGYPKLAQDIGVVVGISSIAALVLVFLPASALYFKACREAALPPEQRNRPAAERPRLFGPRPQAARPATVSTDAPRQPAPSAGRGKSKARSDNEAIARGAELARTRAKASKSRRTET